MGFKKVQISFVYKYGIKLEIFYKLRYFSKRCTTLWCACFVQITAIIKWSLFKFCEIYRHTLPCWYNFSRCCGYRVQIMLIFRARYIWQFMAHEIRSRNWCSLTFSFLAHSEYPWKTRFLVRSDECVNHCYSCAIIILC